METDFDRYARERRVPLERAPEAFAVWLTQATGGTWSGGYEPDEPETAKTPTSHDS